MTSCELIYGFHGFTGKAGVKEPTKAEFWGEGKRDTREKGEAAGGYRRGG